MNRYETSDTYPNSFSDFIHFLAATFSETNGEVLLELINEGRLKMQTWLITGCSSGFGKNIAKAVLEHGWNAVVRPRRNIESI